MNPFQLREDDIGRALAEAERSGELRSARNYGRPPDPDEGWDQTPTEWRMGFKILKDAGVVPWEVELMQKRARLRAERDACTDTAEGEALQQSLNELEQLIALRLESMRRSVEGH